jgi:hypothetical protein
MKADCDQMRIEMKDSHEEMKVQVALPDQCQPTRDDSQDGCLDRRDEGLFGEYGANSSGDGEHGDAL